MAKAITDAVREARRAIAKKASAHYNGAAVSQPQLDAVIAHVQRTMRAGIMKSLGCTERQLLGYANSELSASDLSDKTREKLAGFNDVYSKPWPRKTASMLYELQQDRKRSSRKRTKKAPTEAVETS
jgi:hypothetical protein